MFGSPLPTVVCRRTPVQSKKDNPEKLATYGTTNEDKIKTHQYVLNTTIGKQTQIT
jgi:hypothetical protein